MRLPLPRARGGISARGHHWRIAQRSSPRTRGYFREVGDCARFGELFPAHAGVFPLRHDHSPAFSALPRARGGISTRTGLTGQTLHSSPRTRGYFQRALRSPAMPILFPAHAGVFPPRSPARLCAGPLPRARGGISAAPITTPACVHSSPRTRGYFRSSRRKSSSAGLFPAHAGVFPELTSYGGLKVTLPRARGGISRQLCGGAALICSSPRTRGYFR